VLYVGGWVTGILHIIWINKQRRHQYYCSVKPMVSASHADSWGLAPGAGQILPPLSTHLTNVLDPGVPHYHKR
jgi:hypothetical protein